MLRRAVRSARWHHVGVHGALTLQFWIGADARPHPRVDRKEFEEESPGLGRVRLFVKSERIKSGEMMRREEMEKWKKGRENPDLICHEVIYYAGLHPSIAVSGARTRSAERT